MAIASNKQSSTLNSILVDNESQWSSKGLQCHDKHLNFYESIYNFKKMFPNLDHEVIETVLRSNSGSVERTIDQLLTMTQDIEISEAVQSIQTESTVSRSTLCSQIVDESNDQPPSYNELMSMKFVEAKTTVMREQPVDSVVVKDQPRSSSLISSQKSSIQSKPESSSGSSFKQSKSFINNFNKIVIGELARDFLRIRLNKDQVKKMKSCIKKARRNEIVAMINNKTLNNPELSFELQNQLDAINDAPSQDSSDEEQEGVLLEDWQFKYRQMLSMYEQRRDQVLNDEYLAKCIQNEEFLNELRSDAEFLQTLKAETSSSYNWEPVERRRNVMEINNAELKAALTKMGKLSKAKFNQLAARFNNRQRSKRHSSLTNSKLPDIVAPKPPLDVMDFSSGEKETYSVERIKEGELTFINNSGGACASKSRYKKAYNSFKTALRRNSGSSGHLNTNPFAFSRNEPLLFNDDFKYDQLKHYDSNNNSKNNNNDLFLGKSTRQTPPDLITFNNDYSYDDKK